MDELILAFLSSQDKLKASSLYQIFKGKRTSSILSWGYFNDCLNFLGAFPELSEKDFQSTINKLVADEKILMVDNLLSASTTFDKDLPQVDYFRYGRIDHDAWRSVQFLVQAVSHLARSNSYIPLENAPRFTQPVKQLIHQEKSHIKEQLFDELWLFFSLISKKQAELLAGSLSGYQVWGTSFQQLLVTENLSPLWFCLTRDEAIHQFLKNVSHYQDSILFRFLRPLLRKSFNQSMLQTRRLWLQGYSKKEIMKQRHLKEGTVNDHLIEWAILDENFDFTPFISMEQLKILESVPTDYRQLGYQEAVLAIPELSFERYRLYQIYKRRYEDA